MCSVSTTSIESSNILEVLQWSDVAYRLDEFVDRYTLPQIVKVQEDLNIPERNNSCIRARQLLTLHAVESTEKVLARDRKDHELHLPLDCPNRIELRPHSFRGVCEKVEYLRDFKFVRVTQGYCCLDDESRTISLGDKLEVVGVEEGAGGREGCLVFQNQVQSTIRLPFSVTAGFQPLVDGRDYSLKEVSAMELPVYFQFIDPPDPIGQERASAGMLNCSLGVLKFEKTCRDSIVICTAMSGCATTALVYPKLISMKVLGTLKDDVNYVQICRMFDDRISLPKVRNKELENIYASRNTIREYQECIQEGLAFFAEKSVDEVGGSSSLAELNGTEPIDIQAGVTKGSGVPVFSSSRQQEAEKISDACHDICDDIVSPQLLLTDEHSAVSKNEPAQGVGTDDTANEVSADSSFGDCYYLSGVTETATDDDGNLDLSDPTSTDPLSDEAVQLGNHVVMPVQNCVEADQITDTQQRRPFVGEQPYIMGQKAPARRTEEHKDTKTVKNRGSEAKHVPLGKTVLRLDNNGNQIDSPEQEGMKCNADIQGLKTSHKMQPPPVKEKPKRKTLTPEKSQLSSVEPQSPICGTADMKTESSQALDEVASPTQPILKKTTSALVVRTTQSPDCTGRMVEDVETRGLVMGPEKKTKPKLPVKPSVAAQERAKLRRQGPPPVKARPVFRELSPPVYENSDTQLESGCPTEEASPTTTEPSSTRISSLPVETDASHHHECVEGRSLAMETEADHLDRCGVKKMTTSAKQHLSTARKPVDKTQSLPMEIAASHSERGDVKQPNRGTEQQPKPRARRFNNTAEKDEEVTLQRQQPPPTKPKPPYRRHVSHPVAETEGSSLEKDGATSTERQPPPVKPKPVYKRSSLPLK